MAWYARIRHGLLLGAWLTLGCGPSGGELPDESTSSGEVDATTEAGSSSTALADGGSSGDPSSTGDPTLPCAWVESTHQADIPSGMLPSNVQCDPESTIATLQLTDDPPSCAGSPPSSNYLIIELPPQMQTAGEYDLTTLEARVRVQDDLEPVSGQVDTGTLIITEVTPTAVIGWAHGGLDGYDVLGSFEAPYCD